MSSFLPRRLLRQLQLTQQLKTLVFGRAWAFPHRLTVGGIAGAVLSWSLAALPLARGQQLGNVILEASEQLFCVLTVINASGYDSGVGAASEDSTRAEVRTLLEKKRLAILPELRKFYSDHEVASDPGANLGQYVSLALLLGPPPEFRFVVPQADLPPDAKRLAGMIPLLKSFYNQAGLVNLWARVRPRYEALIDRYSEPLRRSISLTDAYLRFPSGAYLGRTCTIYPDLLGAPDQVHARIYGLNYYVVVTPSKEPKLNEIRHQYLHFLLDPLAVKFATEILDKRGLLSVARKAPTLGADFKEDFSLLVTECLIRAAEVRMDKVPKAEAQKAVNELTGSGLILVPYFYEALGDYERQDASTSVYYKQMILGIDKGEVERRLEKVKFTPAPAPPAQAANPAASEEQRLLDQADNLIYNRRYSEARGIFHTVLEKFNPKSDRALFGLAVVASNTRKPDLAEEYLKKTLETASDRRIVTWSHIYLGRLYDVEGKREDALSHYRSASLTASEFPEALRAVQSGLERPFGSKQ